MKIVFFGTPDFAVPSLRVLIASGYDIAAVVTQPDRLKGRGHLLSRPPVKELAGSKGIPVLQPSGIRTPEFLDELSSYEPDAIVVVAYGKFIPPPVLKLPSMGCINVHASLLPKYRGAAPIQWAIISGDTVTGVTTMLMDEGLDTGKILLQEETEIAADDNALTLSNRLSEIGAALLPRTLEGLNSGSVRPVPQTGEPTFAPILKKEDGLIDWSLPAQKLVDLIRGTYPWPGAYSFLGGQRLTVVRAKVLNGNRRGDPGRIERIGNEEVHVSTGMGLLSVLEVKPEGRKSMPASSFMRGKRMREGALFGA